jgi:hypothetical protein
MRSSQRQRNLLEHTVLLLSQAHPSEDSPIREGGMSPVNPFPSKYRFCTGFDKQGAINWCVIDMVQESTRHP